MLTYMSICIRIVLKSDFFMAICFILLRSFYKVNESINQAIIGKCIISQLTVNVDKRHLVYTKKTLTKLNSTRR